MTTRPIAIEARRLLAGAWSGRSPARIWLDDRLSRLEVAGRILDLGGGGGRLAGRLRGGGNAVLLDLRAASRPDCIGDAEGRIPFRSETFATVLHFNLLEHLHQGPLSLAEAARVLRPGGTLHLFTPFLYPRHTAHDRDLRIEDYCRYGPAALERHLRAAGFRGAVTLESFEPGPFTAGASIMMAALPWNALRCLLLGVTLLLDGGRRMIVGRRPPKADGLEWPIAHWATAIK